MRISKRVGLLVFVLFASIFLLQQSIAADSESREWESGDGKFKVTAKYKEFNEKENKVVLIRKDGKEVSVPVAKLSKNDQDYIKKVAGNKTSDVDSFGQDDDDAKPGKKSDPIPTKNEPEKPSQKPVADKIKKSSAPIVLSAEDEKLAKELFEQIKSASQPVKQPKWEKVWSQHVDSMILEADFSKDGDMMVDVNGDNECEVRNLADGKVIKKGDETFLGKVTKASISPDAKYVSCINTDNALVTWTLATEKEGHAFQKIVLRHQIQLPRTDLMCFLEEGSLFTSAPPLGGDSHTFSIGGREAKDAQQPDCFVLSPDAKKAVLWKHLGTEASNVSIESLQTELVEKSKKKRRSIVTYSLNKKGNKLTGAVCSNDFMARLDATGQLSWMSTAFAQDFRELEQSNRVTTFVGMSARGTNSSDAKYSALVSDHAILAFPSGNPALWKVFCPPPGSFVHDRAWLLPDFERLLTLGIDQNLTLWKSDFKDEIRDAPLIWDLVNKRKFDVLDRAYSLFDTDKELAKYAVVYPWTERFYNIFYDVYTIQRGREASTLVADFTKWADENSNNSLGAITLAKEARQVAWAARGSGFAGTVTEEGWKKFQKKMNEARELIEPLINRDHVPAEALYIWLEICQGTGWDEKDVSLGISKLMQDHPLHGTTHCMTAFSMLPRWHGERGDSEKYAAMVSEKVDPDLNDAVYLAAIKSLLKPRFMGNPDAIFDNEKNPVRLYDEVNLDWERILRGADQIIKQFPDDPSGATLGLFYSIQQGDTQSVKKYIKILDEKHGGIVAPNCKIGMSEMYFARKAVEKQ